MQTIDTSQQARIENVLATMLGDPQRKVYALVKDKPSTKKDLTKRTGWPSGHLDEVLGKLSSFNLVKAIKRPESKNLNVWVLYHHFEEEEQQQQQEVNSNIMELLRAMTKPISLIDATRQMARKGFKVDIINQVIKVMNLRGEITLEGDVIAARTLPKALIPCINCNLQVYCHPGGAISPQKCPYLKEW